MIKDLSSKFHMYPHVLMYVHLPTRSESHTHTSICTDMHISKTYTDTPKYVHTHAHICMCISV